MSLLVLGASGQLARHLRALRPDALCWGRAVRDLSETTTLEQAIREQAPACIVNAAAYTAVDSAESEPDAAWRLNAEVPAAAARAAAALGIPLVHVSTDYVFDGRASEPYPPDAPVNPINVYGQTKLGGELAVRTLCAQHWILRTSWVFSEYGSNFLRTMLRLAAERGSLSVVDDQHGRPTHAGDLALTIDALVARVERGGESHPPFGTFHASGGPVVSWHGFARAIFDGAVAVGLLRQPPALRAITTAEYPTAAARPAYTALAPSEVFLQSLGVSLDWSARLADTLARAAGQPGPG